MHTIGVHKTILQLIAVYHVLGMWSKKEHFSLKLLRRCSHFVFSLSYSVSLLVGAVQSTDEKETIYLGVCGLTAAVNTIKLTYILWKAEQIHTFLYDIAEYSIEDINEFNEISKRLRNFINFVFVYVFNLFSGASFLVIFPIFSSETVLPFNVAFPLDWRNDGFAYWIAYLYVMSVTIYTIVAACFIIIVWYLMLNSGLQYRLLGHQFKTLGLQKKNVLKTEGQSHYHLNLIDLIKTHRRIKETIDQLTDFFGNLFLALMLTSAICICGSVFTLAFSSHANLAETVVYVVVLLNSIFDVFMVTYLGNEIKLTSDRLSYSLFQSEWFDQLQVSKKFMIVLSEGLRKPQQLVIYQLFPLDLNTFTWIINSSYKMFNVLSNFN